MRVTLPAELDDRIRALADRYGVAAGTIAREAVSAGLRRCRAPAPHRAAGCTRRRQVSAAPRAIPAVARDQQKIITSRRVYQVAVQVESLDRSFAVAVPKVTAKKLIKADPLGWQLRLFDFSHHNPGENYLTLAILSRWTHQTSQAPRVREIRCAADKYVRTSMGSIIDLPRPPTVADGVDAGNARR